MATQSTPYDIPPPTSPTACTGRAKGYLNPRIFCTKATFQNSHVIDEGCVSELKADAKVELQADSTVVGKEKSLEVKQKGATFTVHPEATLSIGKFNLVVAEIMDPGELSSVGFQILNSKYQAVGDTHTFIPGMKMLLVVDLRDNTSEVTRDVKNFLQLPLPFETAEEIEAL